MGKIKKYANGIERFLHGEKGQRFFNFAYSIGAAIVIWGALFKILHLPGGSTLLCIGMGTEIAMFILTAFDRPPKEYAWEEVFPALDHRHHEDGEERDMTGLPVGYTPYPSGYAGNAAGGYAEGGEPIEGGEPVQGGYAVQTPVIPQGVEISEEDIESLRESIAKMATAADQLAQMAELSTSTQAYLSQLSGITDRISQSSTGYADNMADLNRNIGGLNTIYEIQLKSISSQLESIDRVNRGLKDIRDMYEKSARQSARYCEETERMARYMQQLNSVYEKMITAMTINMYNPMMGGQQPATDNFNPFGTNDSAATAPTDNA